MTDEDFFTYTGHILKFTFMMQPGPFSPGRGKFRSAFPTVTFLPTPDKYHKYIF
jgi:hypothetical protein